MLVNITSQKHRMVGVGRDLCGSSSPTSFQADLTSQCEHTTGGSNYTKQRAPEPTFTTTSQQTAVGEPVPGALVSFTPGDTRRYLLIDLGLNSRPFESQVYLVWVEEEESYFRCINSQNKG